MLSVESSPSFQPYAFLLHGGRRCSQGANSTGSTPEYLPADYSSGTVTPPSFEGLSGALFASTEHGKYIGDSLEYIVPPPITPVERDAPASSRCLFLGQMRFETTAGEVRWLIKRLCGVVPIKAEIRGSGCCVVHLATDADEVAVRSLNRRVLFDHNGVWFARTADEVDFLIDYVEKVLPRINGRRRSLRLPRDCLVVEDPRSKKMNHRRPAQQLAPSPKDQRHYGLSSSPPSPYSLGSPALSGFHVAPPEYVLGDSVYPQGATHPPPYSWDGHHHQ